MDKPTITITIAEHEYLRKAERLLRKSYWERNYHIKATAKISKLVEDNIEIIKEIGGG